MIATSPVLTLPHYNLYFRPIGRFPVAFFLWQSLEARPEMEAVLRSNRLSAAKDKSATSSAVKVDEKRRELQALAFPNNAKLTIIIFLENRPVKFRYSVCHSKPQATRREKLDSTFLLLVGTHRGDGWHPLLCPSVPTIVKLSSNFAEGTIGISLGFGFFFHVPIRRRLPFWILDWRGIQCFPLIIALNFILAASGMGDGEWVEC